MRPIRLTKARITTELRRSELPTTGAVDELRRRLTDWPENMPETKEGVSTRSQATTPEPIVTEKADPNRNVDRLRESGCVTDGKEPFAFLERVAELQKTYGIADEELLRGVPKMLRGQAQTWYRKEREAIKTWKQFTTKFLAAYSPTRSRFQRERLAHERRQRPDEPFVDYMTAVTTLMRRAQMPMAKRLEMLHENMRTDHRRLIQLRDVVDVHDLLERVQHLELCEEKATQRPATTTTREIAADSHATPHGATTRRPGPEEYDPETYCWRCKQRGHMRFECRNAYRKFCSRCGRDGTLTQDCHPSGNGQRGPAADGRPADPPIRSDTGIRYTPRPLLPIQILGHEIDALLDTGSQLSCVNAEVLGWALENGLQPTRKVGLINMADGSDTRPSGRILLPFYVKGEPRIENFTILPKMGTPVLLGIQTIATLRLTFSPPPEVADWPEVCHATPCLQLGLRRLTETDRTPFEEFLRHEMQLFEAVPGRTSLLEHRIKLLDETPVKQRYSPRNPVMQKVITEEVEKMIADGVIEPSNSPWSSPVMVVRKKDGRTRFCVDFRELNERSGKDAYPLPHIQTTLNKLREARFLTALDLKNGYWQVPLSEASRPLTAFTVPGQGLFQFTVMPFGLHSAPATFQRLLDQIIGPELEPHAFAYFDDIIIVSRTIADHRRHLREVFRRLRAAGLRLNPDKCRFCVDQLRYLGHIVDQQGIRTDPEKNDAIALIPTPKTLRDVRRFHGMASWYRRFVPNFSEIMEPLTRLTRKHARWSWTETEERAFRTMKDCLVAAPILACPDFEQPFTLQTDASDSGLSVMLTQNSGEGERVISYASHTLSETERKYSATEKECLAVVWGIREMKPYLGGYRFTVITDHQALKWLQQLDNPTGRLARWALELQQYDFAVKYRPDKLNHVTDALSRSASTAAVSTPRPNQRIDEWYQRKLETSRNDPADEPEYGTEPWHTVSVDLIGPLPRSRSGHNWLLVSMDRFSKWVELAPLRKATSNAVAAAFRRDVILRHGAPHVVISDNGKHFVGEPFTALLQSAGAEHRRTPPYAPHCNPVERVNKVVKTMIAQYTGNRHDRWDELLDEARYAINTTQHEATGYSPAYVNQGRELRHPGQTTTPTHRRHRNAVGGTFAKHRSSQTSTSYGPSTDRSHSAETPKQTGVMEAADEWDLRSGFEEPNLNCRPITPDITMAEERSYTPPGTPPTAPRDETTTDEPINPGPATADQPPNLQTLGVAETAPRRGRNRRRNQPTEVPPEETPGNNGRPVTAEAWVPMTTPPMPYTGRLLPCVCLWYMLPTGRRVEVPLRLVAERRAYIALPDGTERWTLLFDERGRLRRCKHRPDAPPTTGGQ